MTVRFTQLSSPSHPHSRENDSQFEAEQEMPWTLMRHCTTFLVLTTVLAVLAGCAAPAPYAYPHLPGKIAIVQDRHAIAPRGAPDKVRAAIAAGNRIAGLPYARGGGHRNRVSRAYDCSGATSYVLHAAGLLDSAMPSRAFRKYGEPGKGEWISVYARRDHVFLVVAGLRFDTGWGNGRHGPRWTTRSRPIDGSVIRHPPGL